MKVNKQLNELIRYHKKLCHTSEIYSITTNLDNESFCSDFNISSFRKTEGKEWQSCWIVSFRETYNVIYYDRFEKKEIKLFPSAIKKITYKVEQQWQI